MKILILAITVLAATQLASCNPSPADAAALLKSPEVTERRARFARAMAQDSALGESRLALARWLLPPTLGEVSGLALTSDDRLFAHGDENGVVTEIDYRSGIVIKEFMVGKRTQNIDFEGITIADSAFYMIDSKGDIYEFREGKAGDEVPFVKHETGLKESCEFEGIAYDPSIQSLLLACKNVLKDDLDKDAILIFKWKPGATDSVGQLTNMSIPAAEIAARVDARRFRPTDITVDPVTGNYLIISAQERAFLELSPAGEVVLVQKLPEVHEQAEGLAISRDRVLIIGDEAVSARSALTLYRKI